MSRVELPPGARPFVPQRDLLIGGPSLQRRHRRARVALLGHLLREPMVQQAFDDWVTRYGLREPLETLTTRLDALALDAGLSSRTALFPPESTRDVSTQQAVHQAREAFWNGVTGNGVELEQDAHRLTEQLVNTLGLSPGCVPWLTLELLSCFFDSLSAQIEDRAVTRRYTEEPFPQGVTLRIDPRLSTRQRSRDILQQVVDQLAAAKAPSTVGKMPKSGGRHIDTYVEWLVETGLHGVSVLALARSALNSEHDVPRSPNYDGRRRVQYGIAQARTWLAAVAAPAFATLATGTPHNEEALSTGPPQEVITPLNYGLHVRSLLLAILRTARSCERVVSMMTKRMTIPRGGSSQLTASAPTLVAGAPRLREARRAVACGATHATRLWEQTRG